jgi:signal peptidase II
VPINAFINLTHQQNSGAAFSFLAGAGGWQRWFFVVLASAVSVGIAVWLWRIRKEGPLVLMAGLSLVLGGAIGNLIDRARLGYVTDFIQVWFGNWAFPSFNVADSAISVGAALLIIDALFISGGNANKKGPES